MSYNSQSQVGGVDPQGLLGSLLGKVVGGAVGRLAGGSTGSTIGSTIGGIGGGFLPFDQGVGPQMGQGGQQQMGQSQAEQINEVELQSFLSVLRKIGQGVGTGFDIARQFGVLSTGGPQMGQGGQQQMGQGQAEQINEVELQSFLSVLRKIGRGVGTGFDIARQFGVLSTGGPQMGQGGQQQMGQGQAEQINEVELQTFLSVLRKIGRGVGTGFDIARQFGVLSTGGPQMGQGGQQQMGQSGQNPEIATLLRQALPALQALAGQSPQQQGTLH
jgi:hypothetical protein